MVIFAENVVSSNSHYEILHHFKFFWSLNMPPKCKNTSKINEEEAKRCREEDINAKKLRLIQLIKE